MTGVMQPRETDILIDMLEALPLHLDGLYWRLSPHDAWEGQHHPKLKLGGTCELGLWMEERVPAVQVKWFVEPKKAPDLPT